MWKFYFPAEFRARTQTNQTLFAMLSCAKVQALYGQCLHDAIKKNCVEELNRLLRQPNIELNCRNRHKETPLLSSLKKNRSNAFIIRLIEAGCSVNETYHSLTPLLLAVRRTTLDVAQELLKKGADINAQCVSGLTALQFAVMEGNLEAISMLLYYGADATLTNRINMTPFMWAILSNNQEASEILFRYYDDFSCADIYNRTALHYAVREGNDIAFKLIEAGADVNCISKQGNFPLIDAIKQSNTQFFELIWSKLNHKILLGCSRPFLLIYQEECQYESSEWLKCLYLILSSSVAPALIHECIDYTTNVSLMCTLLQHLSRSKLKLNDRMAVINLCLSLGTTVNRFDIDLAVNLFGFNDEVEALIYADNFSHQNGAIEELFPLSAFIFASEENYNVEFISQLFINFISLSQYISDVGVLRTLRYFSIPSKNKQELIVLIIRRFANFPNDHLKLYEKIDKIPEIPSLLELSRNKARQFIKSTYRIMKPYQFFDAVKDLNCPIRIKDVILFKTPLY